MNWSVWNQIEEMLVREKVRPILAVVPDNADEKLMVGRADPAFWDRVREWADRGWTIAVHGYQHRYLTREKGLIGLNPYSEFAGLPLEEQKCKLERALEIFHSHRLNPDLWVAPAHSMDANTLEALRALGIRKVSDGFALYPHVDARGMLWIPQQMWRFHSMPFGVWTVCMHPNDWTEAHLRRLGCALEVYRERIVSLDAIASAFAEREANAFDAIFQVLYLGLMRLRAEGHAPVAKPSGSQTPVTGSWGVEE
jgi:peptidoglycan/xylan/chitin deacetylase (PgdA/CDA1 family)